ncbi:Z-DNA-binding protein 1 isoform X2 [Mesocricetus auratus]|uniref:Z-DNA-binding protein 1 isoform X2 n=1 Tax=Mesocricetus auratus TaxID=10036 RepID=A0ABM2WD85_MESAU|nr:Z-DNA-binding protein 1 isoform X2 [Mesocricetus auratus]
MAGAAVDLSTGDNLEKTILRVLSEAGSPVKIAKLVKECQVPKKTLNQVLYRLKKEGQVHSPAPATWCLGGDAPGDEALAIPKDPTAQPSLGNLSSGDKADSPQEPSQQWASPDERIFRFLETSGPHRALHIAKALGMNTAKEVNPHLYAMRSRHLLSYDGNTWMIYNSAHPGAKQESAVIIYQQNPTNVISQQGTNNHISIAESKAIQIGHGNSMLRQLACDQSGPRPRHPLSLPVPEDPSSQDTPAGAWGAQLIHMEKSMLRRVQLGHGNEMTLPEDPVEHTAYSFSGSPPVSAASADPGASFNMQSPEPGPPHPDADTAQKVLIKSCLLVDATIGNSNKMTVHATSEGGVVEPGGSEEPKGGTDTSSNAMPGGSCFINPSSSRLLTSELGTMTLGDSGPQTTEPVLREDGAPGQKAMQP